MNHWINTISRDHVKLGVKGGFTQAGHGKITGLKKLKKGDWMIFYSPKTAFKDGEPLQTFTALCRITGGEPYQVTLESGRQPWRLDAEFMQCREVPIKPLIGDLNFIQDKTHWGYMFRFGLFQIPEADFELIKQAMTG